MRRGGIGPPNSRRYSRRIKDVIISDFWIRHVIMPSGMGYRIRLGGTRSRWTITNFVQRSRIQAGLAPPTPPVHRDTNKR
jgi:hypothetical protein